MKYSRLMPALAALSLFAGCFTVHHTEYPATRLEHHPAAAKDMTVAVSGFESTLTSYIPVHGYSTVYRQHPGYYHHGYYYPGYVAPETVSTTSYVRQEKPTTAFVERAVDALEKSGYLIGTTNAEYSIDVKFAGPASDDDDAAVEALWVILSIFTADYSAQGWTAKLKIHDMKTGRLVLSHDYEQRVEVGVWGPIPIFSPFSSSATDSNTMQCWALTALTDRAMADVTAFLATKAQPED